MSSKVFTLLNNRVGKGIAKYLSGGKGEVVGGALHSPENQTFGEEIQDALGLPPSRVFYPDELSDPETLTEISRMEPDLGVCAYFGYILDEAFLDLFPGGIVNVHPAYLPYNRGAYPNVWSIVEGTPAGVTIHYLDAGIDTGDILVREAVPIEPVDTGKTLYRKLEDTAIDLFRENWSDIRDGDVDPTPQARDEGTYHEKTDVQDIDQIDLDEEYEARALIDVLRARTFRPHESAYFVEDGQKVFIRVDLEYADDGEEP